MAKKRLNYKNNKKTAKRSQNEHAIFIYYDEPLMFMLALEALGKDTNEIKNTRKLGNRMKINLNQGVDIYGVLDYINANI